MSLFYGLQPSLHFNGHELGRNNAVKYVRIVGKYRPSPFLNKRIFSGAYD